MNLMAKNIIRGVTLLFLLMTPFLSVAGSDAYEAAMTSFEAGDYKSAYTSFRDLAEEGVVDAQYYLGMLYLYGQGVRKSDSRGVEWLKQAAGNGSYQAAANLGQMYISGEGVALNETVAIQWLELADKLAKAQNLEEDCD
ncbi:sel1 repeat family protein [bacterium endosymbiont of Escarpia laminata]|nr:MAG: sel1 repeat family protein [bacterium endosymbiont of Escarpia laminata]